MNDIFFVSGGKDSRLLVIQRYMFHLHCFGEEYKVCWRCAKKDCKVRAIYHGNNILTIKGAHDHSDDTKAIYLALVKQKIKQLLEDDPFTSAKTAFNKTIAQMARICSYDFQAISQFPSFDNIKSVAYRYKEIYCPARSILISDYFDVQFLTLDSGNNILLYSEFQNRPIIILGEIWMIRCFSRQTHVKIFMDGTFKSASTSFYQLYTIHANFNGQTFPIIYAFLSGKQRTIM